MHLLIQVVRSKTYPYCGIVFLGNTLCFRIITENKLSSMSDQIAYYTVYLKVFKSKITQKNDQIVITLTVLRRSVQRVAGSSPLLSVWATQFPRNGAAEASR